jgi:hypothetical protein
MATSVDYIRRENMQVLVVPPATHLTFGRSLRVRPASHVMMIRKTIMPPRSAKSAINLPQGRHYISYRKDRKSKSEV